MLPQLLRLQPGARACKCITCLTRSAIAKSSATPGITTKSGNRHTILFYTTIISTAAAADVTVKHNRRAEWDRKIEELEQSLQADEGDALPVDGSHKSPTPEVISWSIARNARKPSSILPNFIKANNVDTKAGQIEVLAGLVQQEGGSSNVPTRSNTTPWSIYASERVRMSRKDWTPKKALTVEYAVAKLVSRILLSAPDIRPERKAALLNTIDDLQAKLDQVKQLGPFDIGDLQRPTYPQYDLASQTSEHGTRKLNKVLLRLFRKCRDQTISVSQMLTKVAYNLLVSPAAPDTVTFSELISRFSRLQCARAANIAIEALEETHLRHDQMSVDTILTHYLRHHNTTGFHRYALKLQGYYGGLQLAHPQTILDETSPVRLRRWNNKIVESVDLDARLYATIVSGYQKLFYPGSAEQWSNAMTRANIPRDVPVLLRPLSVCAHSHDWENGLRIWQHIEALLTSPETAFQVRRKDQMGAYHLVLKLCRNTSHLDWFKSIYGDALRQGFSMDELFLNIDPMPLPAVQLDVLEKRRRIIAVLLRRVESIRQDMRELAVQLLAHKVLSAGLSLHAIKQVFSERGMERIYAAWVEERPWLAEAKPWENPLPDAVLRISKAHSTMIELNSPVIVKNTTKRMQRSLKTVNRGFRRVAFAHPDVLTPEQKHDRHMRQPRTTNRHVGQTGRITSDRLSPDQSAHHATTPAPSKPPGITRDSSTPYQARPLIQLKNSASDGSNANLPLSASAPARGAAALYSSPVRPVPASSRSGGSHTSTDLPLPRYRLLDDLMREKNVSPSRQSRNQDHRTSSWPDQFSKSLAVA